VILPSPHGLSTPAVYREFDALGVQRGPDELAELEARGEDLPVHNDLQDAARSLCPPIDAALAAVAATGADHVLVSGSGPTVFGLYEDTERARAAAAEVGGVFAEPVDAGFGAVREA
jgi:4-diphosphocytidyl-2-C-methyl-D-erythritol kinase